MQGTRKMMSTPIGILWTLLSIMVAGTCSFAFLQPFWFIEPVTLDSFGMFSYCIRNMRGALPPPNSNINAGNINNNLNNPGGSNTNVNNNHNNNDNGLLGPAAAAASSADTHADAAADEQRCGIYGEHFNLSNLPSNAWQAACVLYGAGCVFLCTAALLAMVSLCVPTDYDKRMAAITGYMQCVAVVSLVSGLLVFPLGLDSMFVRYHCEGATVYCFGSCHLGWGYMLGIMGTALAMFCPFLSHYTDMKINEATGTYV